MKGPGSELTKEREGQGAKVPGSELARVLLADSLRGANWPGSEKARYQIIQSTVNIVIYFNYSKTETICYSRGGACRDSLFYSVA